jgi:hypothetical protein
VGKAFWREEGESKLPFWDGEDWGRQRLGHSKQGNLLAEEHRVGSICPGFEGIQGRAVLDGTHLRRSRRVGGNGKERLRQWQSHGTWLPPPLGTASLCFPSHLHRDAGKLWGVGTNTPTHGAGSNRGLWSPGLAIPPSHGGMCLARAGKSTCVVSDSQCSGSICCAQQSWEGAQSTQPSCRILSCTVRLLALLT